MLNYWNPLMKVHKNVRYWKKGVTPYHTSYIVENINNTVTELRKQHYVIVSKPAEAVIFKGSRVCFFFNKDVGRIELEAPANIIFTE